MTQTPCFSVIIPVYNQEQLIRRAIDSVLQQRMNDYEIIVVNDGSDDNTPITLNDYSNKIIILKQKNQGPGMARNTGIVHAKGKYVAFLDSDDLWFPWTLEKFYYAIKKHNTPSIISGSHIDIYSEADIDRAKETPYQDEVYIDYLSSANDSLWLGMCATVIRRDLLRGEKTFSSLEINGEDHDLWLSLGTAPGFIYITDPPLFAYRRRTNSLISELNRSIAGSFYLIQHENNRNYPGDEDRKKERWNILGRHIRPVVIACIHNNRLKVAWKLYNETFKWHVLLWRFRFIIVVPFMLLLSMFERNLNKKIEN